MRIVDPKGEGGRGPGLPGLREEGADRHMKSPYLGEGLAWLREVPARGSLKATELEQSALFLGESKTSTAATPQGRKGPSQQLSLMPGDLWGAGRQWDALGGSGESRTGAWGELTWVRA